MATVKLEKPLESNIGADVNANVVTENRVEAVDADTILDCVNNGIGHPSTMNANVETVLATSTGTTCNVCTGLANKPILTSTLIPTSSASNPESVSFATLLKGDTSQKSINFYTLITSAGIGADVVISKESVYVVNERLNNMVYEFFLGKHVAYLVVENYFSFKDMMKSMLENGSWLIHNVPLILRKWTPNANIMMKEVCEGYTMRTIHIEYKWTPPRCSICKVFGHVMDQCPKKPISDVLKNLNNPREANSASLSGKKKLAGLSRKEVSNLNLFDMLNSVQNDDELGTNGGNLKLGEKGSNSGMVSYAYGSPPVEFGSPNTTL
ncbi:hypothetical protein Tco_1063033 [Tanacetum coccineum]